MPQQKLDTICKPSQHDFVPKKQSNKGSTVEMVTDICEVFCRKCGTVCFLTSQEPAEPSRITLARSAN